MADSIDCSDDSDILELAKKDTTIKLYNNANTVNELLGYGMKLTKRDFARNAAKKKQDAAKLKAEYQVEHESLLEKYFK